MVMHDDPSRTYAKQYLNGHASMLGAVDCAKIGSAKKPVDVARDAMQSAINLAERVEAIVNDMIGSPLPGPALCDAVGGPIDGVLPGLAEHAGRTNAAIRDAHAALDRLREVI
ncbi:MAG: hypothetical protein LCH99_15550 [Proteobacteria bacterium]|nr:hypothetical protein [Pseudomonadota bacterium]